MDESQFLKKDTNIDSIADDPSYLPAIFSLCAMGLLENDETLANAALQELGKVPTDTVCKLRFCSLLSAPEFLFLPIYRDQIFNSLFIS